MPSKDDLQEPAQPSSTVHASTAPVQPHLNSDPTAPTVFDRTKTPGLDTTVLPRPEGLIGVALDGRYIIEKELGHGGIGAVYLARDRKLMNKAVVVKVLLEASLQNEWVVRKFQQEKEALTRVDHPGIVGILDAGELPDGKPYIVMQYVDGVTLRSIMQSEGTDLNRAALFIEQTGHALGAAHEKQILHRDLKPENIMVQLLGRDREQIKIIDFGIAKVRNSQVAPSTIIKTTAGTIAYMAPEQLRGEKVDASSDIYALGIIAYELVTGRRPFNPKTEYQALEIQREGVRVKPKELRPALPEAAQTVILKALSFERQDRYQSAAEFGDDFARAIRTGAETPLDNTDRESKTKTLPDGRNKHTDKRKLWPRPALLAVTALLLIGIIAAALWWSFKSVKPASPSGSSASPLASVRTLNYWLTVQKMRDGRPYQETFESSGQEIFENGWKFRFNASSAQKGYLYLLNEGPDAAGQITYNLLYPMPSANSGSAQLNAGQQMQTGWYVFDQNQGTERFWVVWSAEAVDELEAVKGFVNKQDKGTIKDRTQVDAIRAFLKKNSWSRPEVSKDNVKKQTNIIGNGNVIVNLVELEHH